MKKLVFLLFCGALLCLSGCNSGSQSSRQAQVTGDSTVAQSGSARISDIQGKIVTKPSGVRYQEMSVGTGKEIVNGSYVEFDYGSWLADTSGLVKIKGIGTSVGRPGQSFKAEVGVQPLPGLSDGLIGMRVGGSRRVFVPRELGFRPGAPFVGKNVIFEVIDIKEITPEEVTHYQDSVAQAFAMLRRVQDSIQQALKDSVAALGLDSLKRPLDSTGGGQ
jgi:hypothetical protein